METLKKAHLKMIAPTVIVPLAMFAIIYSTKSPAERMSIDSYTHLIATMIGAITWMLAVHLILPAVMHKEGRVK